MGDRPTRHRCPIRRVHADGTTCTHRFGPDGRPRPGEDCAGAAGYEATCSCGHTIERQSMRVIVEEKRLKHLGKRGGRT